MTRAAPPLRKGPLILMTMSALGLGALIVFGAVLPAEFNRDPLGLGKLTGLSRLWAPPETEITAAPATRAREYATPFRADVVEIPLGGFLEGADRSELEYKVRMAKDATLIYAWEVVGPGAERDFTFDQHGHTTPKPGEAMTVSTWRQGQGRSQQGALTAPFDGIQGWFFSNGGEAPVVVRLRIAGFYDLVPAGAPGNEAGIAANVPAAQARPASVATSPQSAR